MDKKLTLAITLVVVLLAALGIAAMMWLQPNAPPPPDFELKAELNPATIKSGETSVLELEVTSKDNRTYIPKIDVSLLHPEDAQYIMILDPHKTLSLMRYNGEKLQERVSVVGRASSDDSKFSLVVVLSANDTVVKNETRILQVKR